MKLGLRMKGELSGGGSPVWGRQAGLEEHWSWEAGLRQSSHPGAPQAVCASSSPGFG